MIRTIADPWLTQNAGRRYPLADDTAGIDEVVNGKTVCHDNAILDFRCTVRGVPYGQVPYATLSRVYYITMAGEPAKRIEVKVAAGVTELATLRFDVPKSLAENAHHVIRAANGPASGEMTVTGHVANLPNLYHDVRFAATTVVADSLGVDSVRGMPAVSYDADDMHHIDSPSAVLTGDVVLDMGANADPYLDGNRLRLEISKGYGRGEWCQRQAATQNCSNVLFMINGERPGSDGDIRLVGEGGVIVTTDPDKHEITITVDKTAAGLLSDDCSAAC